MNYSQPFCDEAVLAENMEQAIGLYRDLYQDNSELYAPKLAALCRASGDYLAYDIEYVWETGLDICLDLNSEKYVPGMPEQKIPLITDFSNSSDVYDFRRARKALSLMRYSAVVYENYLSRGQDDCWIDLAQTYFCLARLLYCLSQWIKDIQQKDIEEIRIRLRKDCFDGYRNMLAAMRKYREVVKIKHPDFPDYIGERDQYRNQTNPGQRSEKELIEFEKNAFSRNPFADCYNFALALYNYGQDLEAAQLHEELYRFFKEVYKGTDPALVLMNRYIYACGIEDIDVRLSLLLEFDESEEKAVRENMMDIMLGCNGLFDYYYEIAECYREKRKYTMADEYFAKAEKASFYFTYYEHAMYNKQWAVNKRNSGDMAGAEHLIWKGLEYLIKMDDLPTEEWNDLSNEYASLLIQTGREQEANTWLNAMIID